MAQPSPQEHMDIKTTLPQHDTEKAQPQTTQPLSTNTLGPIPLERLTKDPAYVQCPFCNVQATTDVNYISSDATCAMAIGCCCILGVLGVWMPYVFHWGADTDHYCSSCKRKLAHVDHNGAVTLVTQQPTKVDEKFASEGYVGMSAMDLKARSGFGAPGMRCGNEDMNYDGSPIDGVRVGERQDVIERDPAPQYVGDAHIGTVTTNHGVEKKVHENPVLPSAC